LVADVLSPIRKEPIAGETDRRIEKVKKRKENPTGGLVEERTHWEN
jgi:hypothetical protein